MPRKASNSETSPSSSLDDVLKAINDTLGPGTVIRMSDSSAQAPVDVISTGILSLDVALGVGGYARGRIYEIMGPESSGKSTVTLHAIAEVQKVGGQCLLVDAEHSFDAHYAEAVGVDVSSLLVCQPDSAEQAIEVVSALVKSEEITLVVLDSVAALSPRAELEGEAGNANVGLIARLMAQSMRRLQGVFSKTNTIFLLVNQYRINIGQMYGNPEQPTGGRAIRYAATARIEVRRKETIGKGNDATANATRCKVIKNKLAKPYTETEFDIEFGRGVPREGCVLDLAVDFGLVKKSGAWFTWGENQIGQGREKAKQYLVEHPEVCEQLDKEIRYLALEEGNG